MSRLSSARQDGNALDDLAPGVPLRSTPGFMLRSASRARDLFQSVLRLASPLYPRESLAKFRGHDPKLLLLSLERAPLPRSE